MDVWLDGRENEKQRDRRRSIPKITMDSRVKHTRDTPTYDLHFYLAAIMNASLGATSSYYHGIVVLCGNIIFNFSCKQLRTEQKTAGNHSRRTVASATYHVGSVACMHVDYYGYSIVATC